MFEKTKCIYLVKKKKKNLCGARLCTDEPGPADELSSRKRRHQICSEVVDAGPSRPFDSVDPHRPAPSVRTLLPAVPSRARGGKLCGPRAAGPIASAARISKRRFRALVRPAINRRRSFPKSK